MNKKKYYNASALLEVDANINIIDGARGIGKSTDICRLAIEKAIKSNGVDGGIAYIRRKDKQVTNALVENYIKADMLKKWTKNKWECIKVKNGQGFLARCKEIKDNGKIEWEYSTFPIIKGFCLKFADDYKSLNYSFEYAIFEEYQSNEFYLDDEPNLLMSLYSTLERGHKNFKMFLIANNICRINPYVNAWAMTNYNRQAKGTIDCYKLYLGLFDENGNEKYLKIAREYSDLTTDGLTDEEVSNKLSDKKKRINLMVTRGDWEEVHTYLTEKYQDLENYKKIYSCYLSMQNATFKIVWYKDKSMIFPYIVPHKKYINDIEHKRVIADYYIKSPLFTRKFEPLSSGEKILFDLIKNHSRFCDNLTGNEFFTALKNL